MKLASYPLISNSADSHKTPVILTLPDFYRLCKSIGFSAEIKIRQGNQRGADNQQKRDRIDYRCAAVPDLQV